MKKLPAILFILLLFPQICFSETVVLIKTNQGDITLSLDEEKAPITVDNFISQMKTGFYDGTIFHRVIDGFMIQGGGFTEQMRQKPAKKTIKNEGSNGLKNDRGTIAMARRGDPDSATVQFFINLKDNGFLNTQRGKPGYAVFGKVTSGMNVVDKIAKVRTTSMGGHRDVPVQAVLIEKVSLLMPEEEKNESGVAEDKGQGKPGNNK
jgi:peptidyl-prolyl cis-trans isomerase A (cyclophilin A)/peptidyl-prolyl cis-trans isomerase B (cyclophilin B)